MARSCIRRLNTSSRLWGFREWMFGSKIEVESTAQQCETATPAKQVAMTQNDIESHLQGLAQSMSEFRQSVQWTELKITDNRVKTKVLVNCEETFNRPIPSRELHSIKTFGDLLKFYNVPAKEPPGKLFPNIKNTLFLLPPNLSIEFPPKSRPKAERKPFQNFNDPKHKTFPNKKQKNYRY